MQNVISMMAMNARRLLRAGFAAGLGAAVLTGCDKPQSSQPKAPDAAAQAAIPAGFVLDQAPDDAKDVTAVKSAGVKNGDEVVIRGIVGGSEKPFAANRAIVQILDPSVNTCNKNPTDGCTTPWDACCDQDNARARSASVQLVDSSGNPVKVTLEGVGGMKPLSEVIVKGKARMEGDALVVDAAAIHVRK